ncbi:MAG: hypothetical protein Q4G58_00125 [bacterium]|nr:hypothetical protein [bacterium]
MLRKIANIFFTLFFVASIIFEHYCIRECGDSALIVVCGGLVVIIAAFLFIDVLVSVYTRERDYILEKQKEQNEAAVKGLREDLQELLKYQKALYVVAKKNEKSGEN